MKTVPLFPLKEVNSTMDELVYGVPVVALRGLVPFPGMVLHFDIGRKKSINAVNTAMDFGREVFLICQKDARKDNPAFRDLYEYGTLARIRQVIKIPDSENLRVIVEGECRGRVEQGYEGSFLSADIRKKKETGYKEPKEGYSFALVKKTRDLFDEYSKLTPNISPEVMLRVDTDDSPGAVSDYLASVLPLDAKDKQELLETLHPLRRMEKLCTMMQSTMNLARLEQEITHKVDAELDDNQREYYLREQIRVLSEELGGDNFNEEIEEYRSKIRDIKAFSEKDRKKLLKEADRLAKMGSQPSAEASVIRTYLDTVLELPWDVSTNDKLDLKKARQILDKDHYGLTDVKDRIIELLAVRKMAPDISGQIICLVGPPGVGKTSIAQSMARAMGRKYARISLGGVRDEAEIRGHRKTYIGSMPGRIINALKEAESNNPLILLDEIDKMASDVRGDPASAMLEVLDGEQNKAFVDHYLELPFDLSKVLFITTANTKSTIPAPLLDRMEVIDLYSYTAEEKFHIAKDHLVPKSLKKHGLTKEQLKFTPGALEHIISDYTREAGVRLLERKIDDICRKVDLKVVEDESFTTKIKVANLEEYLGPVKYKDHVELTDEVGVTNGLAWTAVGGEMLKVEAAVMKGKGVVELTGSLGDVMKESARAAVSYLRSNAASLNIDEDFYKEKDIHIHVPEGAVPKDGPSAGVTIATSLLSALSGDPIDGKVAMTGEISLTGRVMPIGGLREKTMAAYKAGIKTIIIPEENVPDLKEVDPAVKKHVEFVPVRSLNQVWDRAIKKNGVQHEI